MITAGLVGLYPLLPLMKGDKEKESPEQALQESINAVQEVADESLRQDLLAAMAILAGGRFPERLVLSMIRREMVMESPIFREWVREEREEGKAEGILIGKTKGKAEMAHEAICMYLEVKFGDASQDLQQQVKKIRKLEALDKIINSIYKAGSPEEARAVIDGAMKSR
ncbi:MAG: hypothetical protein PHS52_04740 [Desulfotomaculaceae bacterium]|nr:hypothetical protein [Desulfotomaculaceae bacterium]